MNYISFDLNNRYNELEISYDDNYYLLYIRNNLNKIKSVVRLTNYL